MRDKEMSIPASNNTGITRDSDTEELNYFGFEGVQKNNCISVVYSAMEAIQETVRYEKDRREIAKQMQKRSDYLVAAAYVFNQYLASEKSGSFDIVVGINKGAVIRVLEGACCHPILLSSFNQVLTEVYGLKVKGIASSGDGHFHVKKMRCVSIE